MDAPPPSAGEPCSPALACATQLDALLSRLDTSPGHADAPRPVTSTTEGEAAQLHDAVLAVALAAPHAQRALDATAALLETACARSIAATAELGALQVALQAAERLRAQPRAVGSSLAHFCRRRGWAAHARRRARNGALLRRAADVRSYRAAATAFQRWLFRVREARLCAVAVCRVLALCAAVRASQAQQSRAGGVRSPAAGASSRRTRARRLFLPLPPLTAGGGAGSAVFTPSAALEDLAAQLAEAHAATLDGQALRERAAAEAAMRLADARADVLAADDRATAAELRTEQLKAQLDLVLRRAVEQEAALRASEAVRQGLVERLRCSSDDAPEHDDDIQDARRVASDTAATSVVAGASTPPVLGALQTPEAIRAKAARRVELLRSRLFGLPATLSEDAAAGLLPSSDGGDALGDFDAQSVLSEPASTADGRHAGGPPALGAIHDQLSRILNVLGEQHAANSGALAASSQQLVVATSDVKRPPRRAATPDVMPAIVIRVTEVTDEVKRLRSELALAQATLEAVARGAVQASRDPDELRAPEASADPQAMMNQFALVRELADAEAKSAVAATVDQLTAKLSAVQQALNVSHSEAATLRSEMSDCSAALASLEGDRQAAVEEAAQVWEILREAQAALAAHDASSAADEKAREEMKQRLDASEAALAELQEVTASAATAQQLRLDEAAELQARHDSLLEKLSACQASLLSAEEQARAAEARAASDFDEQQTARAAAMELQTRAERAERRSEQLTSDAAAAVAALEAERAIDRHALASAGQAATEASAAHCAALSQLQALAAQGQAMQQHVQSLEAAFAAACGAGEHQGLAHHELMTELEHARADYSSLQLALSAAEEQLARITAELAFRSARAADLHAALTFAEAELRKWKARAAGAVKRAEEADAACEAATTEWEAAELRASALQERVPELQASLEVVTAERDAALAAMERLHGLYSEVEQQLAGSCQQCNDLETELRNSNSRAAGAVKRAEEADAAELRASALQERLRELQASLEVMTAERDAALAAMERFHSLYSEVEQQLAGARQHCSDLDAALTTSGAELLAMKTHASASSIDVAEAEAARQVMLLERDAAEARAEALDRRALELHAALEAVALDHDAGTSALEQLSRSHAATEEQLAAVRLEVANLTAALAAANGELLASTSHAAAVASEAAAAHAARREVDEALGAAAEERDGALARAAASHERTLELQAALDAATAERVAGGVALEELRSQHASSVARAGALQEQVAAAHAQLQLVEAALVASRQSAATLEADCTAALSRNAELQRELLAAAAQGSIMEARLADAFTETADARGEVQRLELELVQAQAETEETAALLQQLAVARTRAGDLEAAAHLLSVERDAASAAHEQLSRSHAATEEQLAGVRLEVANLTAALAAVTSELQTSTAHAAAVASEAAAAHAARREADQALGAAAEERNGALARAAAAAEKRARLAEAALGEEVAECGQLRSLMTSLQAHAETLASGAAMAHRAAVLAALGASPCCKEGTLWVRPEGQAGKTADWARKFATLSRTGVLQLHDGPTATSAVQLRVDVADCSGVTTAPVASYRTRALTMSKASAFCVLSRDADPGGRAALLVASGLTDVETTSWAALLAIFLPVAGCSAGAPALPTDAFTPLVARRIAYA